MAVEATELFGTMAYGTSLYGLRSRQATLTDRLRALDAAVPSVAALRAAGSVSDIGAGESLD